MKREMSSIKELTFDEVQGIAGGCHSPLISISGGNGGNGEFGGRGGNGGDVNINLGGGIFGLLGILDVARYFRKERTIAQPC